MESLMKIIIIVLIVIIFISCMCIAYKKGFIKKKKLIRKKIDTNNKKYLKKIFDNKKILNISNNKKKNINNVIKKLEDIDTNSLYSKVYILNNVISKEDCLWIIYESEKYAKEKGWARKRHEDYPTIDNDIKYIDLLKNYIYNITYINIIPEIARKYKLNSKFLGINEIFIVKYNMEGQKKLKEHEDGSEFSFVIPLNNDFTGGGTKFKFIKDIKNTEVGNVIIFCGKHRHKGIEIKSGERYIIAGFLNYGWERDDDDDDE